MIQRFRRGRYHGFIVALLLLPSIAVGADDAALREKVVHAVDLGQQFLIRQQLPGGSWSHERTGVTALCTLALSNSGLPSNHPSMVAALNYLREQSDPADTYDLSVMIMALAAVDGGRRDAGRIQRLALKLEQLQRKSEGDGAGAWAYRNESGWWDNSNTQFALLALREAAQVTGFQVDRTTWRRSRDHWLRQQKGRPESVAGAGWNYRHDNQVCGSMTVAGISSLVIIQSFLLDDPADGRLVCCGGDDEDPVQLAIDGGVQWLSNNFQIRSNPGRPGEFLFYYLYGLERAGRLSGRRFFGDHDWYREGAAYLTSVQQQRTGQWTGVTGMETNPIIATSFALLFLSKGLAPVLVNKLKYGPRDPATNEPLSDDWNRHPTDIRNLTDHISSREGWPPLMTWQVVDLARAAREDGVQALLQAPVQYLSGSEELRSIREEEVEMLREYIAQGGFLFAVQNCESAEFDQGFRDLVTRLFPDGDYRLKRLPETHDVYRTETVFTEDPPELWGVDLGCRTAIMYAPFDHGCRWARWMRTEPVNRATALKTTIAKSVMLGVNVIAYATNRELHDKLQGPEALAADGEDLTHGRVAIRLARIRHTGGWDTAPNAVRHLMRALQEKLGLPVTMQSVNLPATDPKLLEYPLLYMHGRQNFSLSPAERDQLRRHLENGGLLFADACCGSPAFDRSFRTLVEQLFGRPLDRIPIEHELFKSDLGYDIRQVRRRIPTEGRAASVLQGEATVGEPVLEGIEVNGRYVVIYSKYDISCALDKQATLACAGYVSEDATRIATNIVLYSFLQQLGQAASVP